MNVLPLVSAFLLIFAICSYTFVHNVRTAVEEKVHVTGSYRLLRKFSNVLVKDTYKTHPIKKNPSTTKKTNQEPSKKEAQYKSPRDWFKKRPESKCNIRPLLSTTDHAQLEKIALTLIQDLYYFAPFYKPGLEKEILTTLIETLKEDKTITNFDILLTKIPKQKVPLFYKLIKGTHHYILHTTKGYPAIGDFISLDFIKGKPLPIHFCFASRPVLEAVFGPTIAPLIIHKEKCKWEDNHKDHPMNKEELEEFLLSHRLNPTDYLDFFSFSTTKHEFPLEVIHDEEAHLQLKISRMQSQPRKRNDG